MAVELHYWHVGMLCFIVWRTYIKIQNRVKKLAKKVERKWKRNKENAFGRIRRIY